MPVSKNPTVRLFQIFSARLVLEVFGGAGAIWGFSEAITLRTPATLWFWRPCALTVGFIFFIRWLMQIQDFLDEAKEAQKYEAATGPETVGLTSDEKKEDGGSYGGVV